MPATSTTPIETYQRIAALPSNDSDGDMQNGRRKALKSFVLHIRVRIGLRPQAGPARPVPLADCATCLRIERLQRPARLLRSGCQEPHWHDHGYAAKLPANDSLLPSFRSGPESV